MRKASWMALLTIGMLPAAVFGDDVKVSNAADKPADTLSIQAMLQESSNASRLQLNQPVGAMAYSDEWQRPIADLNFRNNSLLARVSNLRNLSLLTLADFGQARLFLGVNHDGLVGLHFSAFPRYGKERYLEVVRMPYLKDNKPHTDVERPEPDSN